MKRRSTYRRPHEPLERIGQQLALIGLLTLLAITFATAFAVASLRTVS